VKKLPREFRHIRLELAREPGFPAGDPGHGYDIVAPLNDEGKIDSELFLRHGNVCRVRWFASGKKDRVGRLVRGPGGRWGIDYDADGVSDEEAFRLGDEVFAPGEYVSIGDEDGTMHTYNVIVVREI